MDNKSHILVLYSIVFFITILLSKEVEESSTGALLSFPYVVDGDLFNVTWEVEPAAFGFADYGGTLEAWLVLPANESYHVQCDNGEPSGLNDYIHSISDWETTANSPWIMIIDRGDCYFATKVYNAEELGASGVIVIDYREENLFAMWEPDNFENDITIPSVELSLDHGTLLMNHLGVENWNPKHMENCTYPSVYNFTVVKAKIEWGLPHEDDRVEWEMWTSANDDRTIEFKRNFKDTALMLDFANDTVFTPHYYILNGSHWKCDSGSHLRCGNQCSNSGRYCAVDPEYDLSEGIAGMDVIQENLRELCIWNFTTHGELDDPIYNEAVWWDYVILWNDNCFNDTNNELLFNANCSYRQMTTLDPDGSLNLIAYVNNCIETTGGYGYLDGENTLLNYEVDYREDLSVHALPTFRVNEFMIYGEVDCEIITEQECSIFDSICSGFINGTEPDICHATPSPTALCDENEKDCSGTCYGTYQYDRCGTCMDPTSSQWNSCVGCNNVTNSGWLDNNCGVCADSSLTNFSDYGRDCDNRCDDGTYKIDECNLCRYVYSSQWNGCFGCDNIAHSGKETNPCGYCILNTTTNFDTYGQDCNGTCDGQKETDQCEQCLETSDNEWNSCVGCDNVAYSNATWRCGSCVVYGTDAYKSACTPATTPTRSPITCNDSDKDCYGTCYGTYKYDRCDECLDPTSSDFDSCVGCDNVTNSEWSFNTCEVCANSQLSNFSDYGKDCDNRCDDGTYKIDDCDECRFIYSIDWNKCVGCDNIAYSHKKWNPCGYCILNTTTNFNTYGQDCNGTCNGNLETDQCNQCLSTSSINWNKCVGCDNIVNSGMEFNPCGYCISNTTLNFSTYGQDCDGICGGSKDIDQCGQCLSTTSNEWNSCVGCDGIPYSNATCIHNDNSSSGDTSGISNNNNNNGSFEISTTMIIVIIIVIVLFILVGLCIYRMYKKQSDQDRAFQNIVKTYALMEPNPSHSSKVKKNIKKSKKEYQSGNRYEIENHSESENESENDIETNGGTSQELSKDVV